MRNMTRIEKEMINKRLVYVKRAISMIAKQRDELFKMDDVIPGLSYASALEIMVKQSAKLFAEKEILEAKLNLINNDFEADVQRLLNMDHVKLRTELKNLIKEMNTGVYNSDMISRRNILEKKIAELKKVINTEYTSDICDRLEEKMTKTPERELSEEISRLLSNQCGFDVNVHPDDIHVINSFEEFMNIINKGNETGCKSDYERIMENEQKSELINILNNTDKNISSPGHLMTQAHLKDFEVDTFSKVPLKFNESPSWTDIKDKPVKDTEECFSEKFKEVAVKLMENAIKEDPGFRSLITQMTREYDNRK